MTTLPPPPTPPAANDDFLSRRYRIISKGRGNDKEGIVLRKKKNKETKEMKETKETKWFPVKENNTSDEIGR